MYLKPIKQPTWLGCSFSPSPGHHSAAPIPSHTWCFIFLMMNSETGDKFLRTCGACPWSLWSQPARFLTRWSDEGHGENKIEQNRLKMVQGFSPENDNPYCTAPACPSAARSPVAACSSTPARGRNEQVDQTEEKPTLRSLFFISACSSCVSSSCSSSLWQTTNVNHECNIMFLWTTKAILSPPASLLELIQLLLGGFCCFLPFTSLPPPVPEFFVRSLWTKWNILHFKGLRRWFLLCLLSITWERRCFIARSHGLSPRYQVANPRGSEVVWHQMATPRWTRSHWWLHLALASQKICFPPHFSIKSLE